MLKRNTFIFVSNLQYLTCDPKNPLTLLAEAYLLSEQYATPSMVELALFARKRRNLIISDNGNFSRMSSIAKQFQKEGSEILALAKSEVQKDNKISVQTMANRKQLVTKIAKKCAEELAAQDKPALIKKQLKIKPHYMIGLEDFTIPTLSLCGMMEPVFASKASDVSKYQSSTLALFKKQVSGKFCDKSVFEQTVPFVVIHSFDYSSAYQAGKKLRGKDYGQAVAISYGAPMNSNRYIESIKFGNTIEKFDTSLPEKYLLAQSTTIGALNGIKKCSHLHLLGLGSPILIALTAGVVHKCDAISIDSTSPFKDSDDGSIYVEKPALLKSDMNLVAARCLVSGEDFVGDSPFWKDFNKKHPSDWGKMREALEVTNQLSVDAVAKELVKNNTLAEKYIPFFAKMRSGKDELIVDLRRDRAGHNYWMLRKICEQIRQRKNNQAKLDAWLNKQVESYCEHASPKWAEAVRKVHELTKKYSN